MWFLKTLGDFCTSFFFGGPISCLLLLLLLLLLFLHAFGLSSLVINPFSSRSSSSSFLHMNTSPFLPPSLHPCIAKMRLHMQTHSSPTQIERLPEIKKKIKAKSTSSKGLSFSSIFVHTLPSLPPSLPPSLFPPKTATLHAYSNRLGPTAAHSQDARKRTLTNQGCLRLWAFVSTSSDTSLALVVEHR